MPTTAVKLPAALEKFVDLQVSEGTFRNREAAIVAAVSHQKRRCERLARLQSQIQKGLDSGPTVNSILRTSASAVAVGLPLASAGFGANAVE